jgi:hypothetical protein
MGASKRKKLNWKQKVVRDLERVEHLLPEPDFMQGDWPEWANQMFGEVLKTAVPGLKFSNIDDPTADELGRFVGAKQAAIREVEEKELSEKEESLIEEFFKKQWGEKAEEKFMERLEFYERTFRPAYQRAISHALALASKQTPQEQAAFFRGYARLVEEGPDERADTTTKIYFIMSVNWRLFDSLAKSGTFSVRQLHEFLCKVFGSHLVGDLKKTEKMCERKGLSFRKRGRPPAPPKSDIPPA